MKPYLSASRAKALTVAVAVVFLTLASFGLGVSVGEHRSPDPAALPAHAEQASAANGSEQIVNGDNAALPLDQNYFREAYALLQKQFYGDLPQGKTVTYNAIRGVVDRLGDSHTAFLDPDSAAIANADIQGKFEGIGCRVELNQGGGVLISYLFTGQPAQQAGLQVGDVVTRVDGKDVTHLSLTEATALIRGPHGTRVTLTLQRGTQPPLDLVITRARIEIPVVETKSLGDGTHCLHRAQRVHQHRPRTAG